MLFIRHVRLRIFKGQCIQQHINGHYPMQVSHIIQCNYKATSFSAVSIYNVVPTAFHCYGIIMPQSLSYSSSTRPLSYFLLPFFKKGQPTKFTKAKLQHFLAACRTRTADQDRRLQQPSGTLTTRTNASTADLEPDQDPLADRIAAHHIHLIATLQSPLQDTRTGIVIKIVIKINSACYIMNYRIISRLQTHAGTPMSNTV